jgi:transcriptional regulator with XRE-family HTH domain
MVIIGHFVFPRSQFDVRVGKRLARARNDMRMTQEEVGKRLGVSPDTVCKWELGVRRPGVERLGNLARIYGVSAGFFLD